MTPETYDVAIVGGGPAGSTVGSLLAKYKPTLRVLVLEREQFPRDHVGESLLPVVSIILDELGAWDKIEAAGFPVKIGATYRWGRTQDLWDFEFLPNGNFQAEPRPAKYEGQRRKTAFQVDRARYDDILLRHCESLGCEVRETTQVRKILHEGDRVTGLILEDGSKIEARYYVDASGHSGILRRSLSIPTHCPTTLQNIAIWDYWKNADWAVSIGVGGTRVQVLSQRYGWIWFIPIGPDRTSIGLIVPATYYKSTGRTPDDLYLEAVREDPLVAQLTEKAVRENRLSTTTDWSFAADRLAGENWFLAGESAGFADPILAAGLSLTHMGARDVAYAILELDRNKHDSDWVKRFYSDTHLYQIKQHMRFAEFWYGANGMFSDLKDEARRIAADAGLELSSEKAWQWLGQGGFIERDSGTSIGGYGLFLGKKIISDFTGEPMHFEIAGKTHFRSDLGGAQEDWTARYSNGRISKKLMYRRNGKILPMVDEMGWLATLLQRELPFERIVLAARDHAIELGMTPEDFPAFWQQIMIALEAMVGDGWVVARTQDGARPVQPISIDFSQEVHENHDRRRL